MIFSMNQYRKGCKGKEPHLSLGKARSHARQLTQKAREDGSSKVWTAYVCIFCRKRKGVDVWHVGHDRRKK
jgi:hypothetical protein